MYPAKPSAQPPLPLQVVLCPLCDQDGHRRLLRVPDWYSQIPGEFWIVECQNCRHCYMNPSPVKEALPRCYPQDYAPHQLSDRPERSSITAGNSGDLQQMGNSTPWYLSPAIRAVPGLRSIYYWLMENHSQPIPPVPGAGPVRGAGPVPGAGRRALEIGCGAGKFLEQLSRHGWEAEGLEVIPAAVDAARSRGFRVHQGDVFSLAAPAQSFDAIFAWQVLEHLTRPRETLLEIFRILRSQGHLGVSVPNFGSLGRRLFGRYWSCNDLPRHLQHFKPHVLKRLLRETGFTDIRVIHQAQVIDPLGSLGLWLSDTFPRLTWGAILRGWFFQNPPLAVQLAVAPWVKLQAACRQGDRITVTARRSEGPP